MNFLPLITSKTNVGLMLLLVIIVGLSLAGKLTPQAVDALKWIGSSFFLARVSANLPGNNPPSAP